MLYVDYTLLIQIVQFLVIIYIGKKMILDPVMKTVDGRDSRIDGMKQGAEDLKAQVEQYKQDYTEKMNEMRVELAEYHRKIKEEASKEANAKVQAVKAELDGKVAEARAEIEAGSKKAKEEMNAMVAEISDMIVDRIMLSA